MRLFRGPRFGSQGGGGGGGAVASVFGRVGVVTAQAGDYTASLVDNNSGVPGTTVADALDTLAAAITPSPVASVFGRVGAIAAVAGDYSSTLIDNTSSVTGTTVTDALNNIWSSLGSVVVGPPNTFLKGTGAGNAWAALSTTPANPGDNGKVVIANAGDFTYLAGTTAGQALIWSGSAWAAGVNFSALSPTTTGDWIITGTTGSLKINGPTSGAPASQGSIRLGANTGILARDAGNTTDNLILYWATTSSSLSLNDSTAGGVPAGTTQIANVNMGYTTAFNIRRSGVLQFQLSSGQLLFGSNSIIWDITRNATMLTTANGAASGTGNPTRYSAQDMFGSGTVVGGAMTVAAGAGTITGAVTSQTGGVATFQGGDVAGTTGTIIGGDVIIRPGGNNPSGVGGVGRLKSGRVPADMFTWNDAGIAFYGGTPVVQAARVGLLTDSTTGTPSATLVDVGAVPTQANINNNFASLAAKYNGLETAIHNLRLTA